MSVHSQDSATSRSPDGEKAVNTWEQPVLTAVCWVIAILGGITLLSAFSANPHWLASLSGLISLVFLGLVWVSVLIRRLSGKFRLIILCAFCYGVAALVFFERGPGPGAVLILLLFALMVALYLGRRAALGAMVAVLALYGFAAVGWHRGDFPLGHAEYPPDMQRWNHWITWALGQLAVTSTVVLIIDYILRDLRHTIARLTASEQKFTRVFAASPDGLAITELATGRLLEINTSYERIFGLRRQDVLGKTSLELGLWKDPADRTAMVQEIVARQPVRARELTIPTKGGAELTLLYSAEPIEFDGRSCLLIAFCDITERKRLEAQLRQAQKLEALGTLAGGVAHDFNNVLTAVSGNAELLALELPPDHATGPALQSILSGCKRARDLVGQILTFSRRTEPRRQRVHLAQLISETVALLRVTIPANIEIRTELLARDPAVLCDPAQLHQVLVNLCTNAVHAMKPAGGVLTLRETMVRGSPELAGINPRLREGSFLSITVQDTGRGIDRATMAHIFEPFFTTKQTGEGTGIGLAVVHGIVEAHEGAIAVQSQPDAGSQFQVFLPVAASSPLSAPPVPESDALPIGRGETILVLDDEVDIVDFLKRALTRLGYTPIATSDPTQAIAQLRAAPAQVALVLTDLRMPGWDGIEVAREMHGIAPTMPIVLMSGFLTTPDFERARTAGIVTVLKKPLDLPTVARAFHDNLAKRRGA